LVHLHPHTEAPASLPDLARLSGPGVRTFFKLAALWDLSLADQQALLGQVDAVTLRHWKRGDPALLDLDQLERITVLLGLHKSLDILVPNQAKAWIKRPNADALFGGKTPLAVMAEGGLPALQQVRTHLEAQLGVWP